MRKLTLIFLLSLPFLIAFGQNNTNSPYSVFGIGELDYSGGGRNLSMGETGIALRSDIFMNQTNPASLTAIPRQSVATDLGINFKYTNLKNHYKSANVLNGNISWAFLAFPINRTFSAGISLNPMSSVGYTIYSVKTIEGTTTNYPVLYTGAGGLSEGSLAVSALISEKLSIGLKSSLLWGNMTKTTEEAPVMLSSVTRIDSTRYIGMNFKSGFQYQTKFNTKTIFTIGGIVEYSGYLNGSSDFVISTGSEAGVRQAEQQSLKLPLKAGVGTAVEFKNKYLVTFDYTRSDWKSADINFDSKKLTVNNSYHIGVEITPKNDPMRNIRTVRYRFGGFYQTGYINVYGSQINSYSATCGISMPIRKDRNFINFSMEFGKQGSLENQLIRESFLKFNMSFNLSDHWFISRKYD